jgi:hypothetical protein
VKHELFWAFLGGESSANARPRATNISLIEQFFLFCVCFCHFHSQFTVITIIAMKYMFPSAGFMQPFDALFYALNSIQKFSPNFL